MALRLVFGVVVWVFGLSLAWSGAPLAVVQEPDALPPGKGREILESACTSCHEFEEMMKVRGKLTKDEWRTVVRTMIDYGAEVNGKDVDVLVEYLNQHLGKRE